MQPSRGPEASPGFLLWRATLRWQRDIAAALRPYQLTHVQFVLLASVWWLSEHAPAPDQHPRQADLAAHAGTDVMMTSSVLRGLEGRGLVTRTPDPADARVRRLAVTDEGRRLALQSIEVVDTTDAAFFAPLAGEPRLVHLLSELSNAPRAP